MAVKGLWNIGNFNIPDLGISEKLGIGPNNAAIMDPNGMRNWPQANISIPSNIQLSPNANPALVANQQSAPTPTPTTRTYSNSPAPQPQPVNVNGNDAGSIRNAFPGYAGWSDAAMIADFKATQGAGKGGNTSSGLSNEWDALFGQTLGAYGNIESMYNEQAKGANEGLTAEANAARSAYEEAFRRSKESLGMQKTELDQSQQKLNSEAIRAYNALKQQGMTRYGGGSSTGNAIAEIASQQFIRTQGDLHTKYVAGQMEIQKAERETNYNLTAAMQDLETKRIAGMREIQNNLNTAINEIELKKAQLADDKQAARLQALQQANDRAQQLAADRESKIFDLGIWKIQRQEEMGVAQKALDELASQTMASLKLQQQSMANELPEFQSKTSFSPQYPLNKTTSTDPFKELLS